jgi:chromosome segregation ATPase
VALHAAFAAAAERDQAEALAMAQAQTEAANTTIVRLQNALQQADGPDAAQQQTITTAAQEQQDLTAKLAAERARVAQLTAIVQSSDDALADLHAALIAARADVAAKSEAMALQAERIAELEFRQRQARDELRRFEGQMDLIKDLLLRGERL